MEDALLVQFHQDGTFKKFLEEDFNARDYANTIIQSSAISDSLSKLADGISLLDQELHAQVVSHHEDLLQQATGIETLEGVLQMMQTRIHSLQASVEKIRHFVNEPYNKIVSRTAQLRRLQAACDLLRRVIRVVYLNKRLHSQLQAGPREITKAAQSLSELDYLTEGVDLSGIQVLESDTQWIKQARVEVEKQAQKMLHQGMESQNQTQVATALQVFHNLDSLQKTVNNVVTNQKDKLQKKIQQALDANSLTQTQGQGGGGGGGPGRATMPTPGNTASWRGLLWSRLETLMDDVYDTCGQVHHLQKILAKKKDPVTHVCFMDELTKDGQSSVLHTFWESVTQALTNEFAQAAHNSTFLKQAFEGEYPKLLHLYNDLWSRLQQFAGSSNTTNGFTSSEQTPSLFHVPENHYATSAEELLRFSLGLFEKAYISRSLSRLFDPINLVFPGGAKSPPSKDELNSIVKTISSELNVASVDENLMSVISKNVAKTIQLYGAKCEQLLVTSADAKYVSGPVNWAHERNAAIVNTLSDFSQAISKILSGLSSPSGQAVQIVQGALMDLSTLMKTAIEPFCTAVVNETSKIIFRMHAEDFTSNTLSHRVANEPEAPCSTYINELQTFINRIQKEYFSLYNCPEFTSQSLRPVASRVLELFVQNASLLRPLGEGGKLKLAADMAQVEFAIGPLCQKVSELGKPYKLLRSFRPLVFQSADEIANNSALGESVPYSTVLHFLFSRAPEELKSPHTVAGWSLRYYSQWLEDHKSEQERLALIKGTLEAYVQSVRSRGEREFTPLYPVMLSILQQGTKH